MSIHPKKISNISVRAGPDWAAFIDALGKAFDESLGQSQWLRHGLSLAARTAVDPTWLVDLIDYSRPTRTTAQVEMGEPIR